MMTFFPSHFGPDEGTRREGAQGLRWERGTEMSLGAQVAGGPLLEPPMTPAQGMLLSCVRVCVRKTQDGRRRVPRGDGG